MYRMTLVCGLLLGVLTGCGKPGAEAPPPSAAATPGHATRTIWEQMVQRVIPASNSLWELTPGLWDEKGNLDVARLTAAQWQQIQTDAETLRSAAQELESTTPLVVAPAGGKILNEGMPGALTAAQVQAAIDADEQTFRRAAGALGSLASALAAAAAARDGTQLDERANQLTDVCGDCHAKFWTPGQ